LFCGVRFNQHNEENEYNEYEYSSMPCAFRSALIGLLITTAYPKLTTYEATIREGLNTN